MLHVLIALKFWEKSDLGPVLDLRWFALTCVGLVLDSCWFVLTGVNSRWFVLTGVDLCWYSCIRTDLIESLGVFNITYFDGKVNIYIKNFYFTIVTCYC